MREILFDFLRSQKEVVIYGCGRYGQFLKWLLTKNHINIKSMCDSNAELWGKRIDDIVCISPTQLLENKNVTVIIGIREYQDVYDKLKSTSFTKILTWKDVSFLLEDLYEYPLEAEEYRRTLLDKQPKLKENLFTNKQFKDIHKGKRCFIIGNGPSIKQQDLSLLQNEITFTVNQMARNPQFNEINTNYHLWADPGFFKTDLVTKGDYRLLEIMKQLPKHVNCFFPFEVAHEYIEKYELKKHINVNYYSSNALVGDKEVIDFASFVSRGYTVVQYAIRLAIYMGCKEIYILGCECTTILNVINARLSEYTATTHCYDIDEIEKQRAREMYMRLPMQAYYESEWNVLNGYRALKDYCEIHGIKFMNCTKGGLLNEIPMISYEEIV